MRWGAHDGRRVLFLLGMAVLTGCRSIPPPIPLDELNVQQTHGHVIYQARCARCHYERKDAPLHGPSLAGLFKQRTLPSGAPANDERITSVVRHGRNTMPALGATIDQQTMDDLLAYLHTI